MSGKPYKPDEDSNLVTFAATDRCESADLWHTVRKRGVKSLTDGSMAFVYGKNAPFRSWPISANELEEVTMGSETNV